MGTATVTRPSSSLPDPGDYIDAEPIRDYITNILAFLESASMTSGNVDTSGIDAIMTVDSVQTVTGKKDYESTAAAGGGAREVVEFALNPASGTAAANDAIRTVWRAKDDGGNATDFAYLDVTLADVTSTAETGVFDFYVIRNGGAASLPERLLRVGLLDTAVDIVPPAVTHTAATNVYQLYVRSGGAQTIPAGTTALVATARFDEPNITATGTVTDAVTVYISGAPTEGGTGNYALWVDDGWSRFDGGVISGANVVSDTDSTDDLGTTSVRWANVYTDAIGDSGQALTLKASSITGPSALLAITNPVAGNYAMTLDNSNATSPFVLYLRTTGATSDNNTTRFITAQDATAERFIVYSDGDVVNHDNSYGGISDQSLKTDIVDARDYWADWKLVQFRKFRFYEDVTQYGPDCPMHVGVIAQEMQTVFPSLVEENAQGVLSVKYSVLSVIAGKVLQEAVLRIDDHEARIAALEA